MKIKLRFITAFCSLTQTESSNEMDMLAMRHCISSKFSLYATVRQIHLLATDTYMYFRLRFDSWSTYFFLFYYDTDSDTIELLHCVTMLKVPFISMGWSTVEHHMEIKGTL